MKAIASASKRSSSNGSSANAVPIDSSTEAWRQNGVGLGGQDERRRGDLGEAVRRYASKKARSLGTASGSQRQSYYRHAQRRFQVGWHVLAAVNFVESAFGRLRSPSWAGAIGPMQFLPSTWRAYGGNVHDPRDAILGAANYLRATGAPRDYRRALYA